MTFANVRMDSASIECAARAIGVTLREAAARASGSELLAAEAERLRRVVVQTQPVHPSRSPIRLMLAAAAVFGAVVVGGYLAVDRATTPLWVEARTGLTDRNSAFVRVGTYHLAAPEIVSSELRFSDGSRVIVETGSRLRVQELSSNGATLLLEKGRANVQVVHRDNDTRWSVAAGPFLVAVTGTRFDIAWDPSNERVVVELHEGRVEIAGPKLAAKATLLSGQRFEALASESGWGVTPLGMRAPPMTSSSANLSQISARDETTREGAPKPVLLDVPVEVKPRNGAARTRLASGSREVREKVVGAEASASVSIQPLPEGRQWAKLVAKGEFKQVTREADAMGLMVCLSNCSASDLRALADASRYTGRLDTAEAALRVLHDRFPAQASSAAYLLGTVDEARGRNVNALRWYDEYLSRTNAGGFVAEARAARLRVLVATGGNVAARQAASEYLEQYPKGAAAGLATKVLEGR